MHVKNINDDSY